MRLLELKERNIRRKKNTFSRRKKTIAENMEA
jgi:hypothetical protein